MLGVRCTLRVRGVVLSVYLLRFCAQEVAGAVTVDTFGAGGV